MSFFYSGRLFLFLGKREYVSSDGVIESIKGVANIPDHQQHVKGTIVGTKFVLMYVYCSNCSSNLNSRSAAAERQCLCDHSLRLRCDIRPKKEM